MEEVMNVKYGEDFFTSLIGKLIFIIPEDGGDPPITLKVQRYYTEDMVKKFEPNTTDKLAKYLIDPSSSTKYLGKQLSFSDGMYEHIKSTMSALQRSVEQIEMNRKLDLDRYVELRDKISLVGSIDGLNPNSEEVELYKLHQTILKRYPDRKPIETDEEVCERMKKMNVRLYTTAKLIPLGPDYDNCRDYLRAYNRLKKKRQAERKKAIPQQQINQIINQPSFVLEIMPPDIQPGFILEIVQPEPILEIVTPNTQPNFILEILPSNPYINNDEMLKGTDPFDTSQDDTIESYVNKLYDSVQIRSTLYAWDWEHLKRVYTQFSNLPIEKCTNQQLFILNQIRSIYILSNHTMPKGMR